MNAKTVTPPAAQPQPAAALAKAQQAQQTQPQMANPFQKSPDQRTNAGIVAIESERAIAEAQGKLVLAKRFPRDQYAAFEAMRAACQRPGLAAEAFYEFPRGKKADGTPETVRGPSIRLAEELARCWGNFEYGMRELSNDETTHATEMLAFAWDLETNTQSSQQFTVRHKRDGGNFVLTSQRDIYEIAANMGARRMRSRILAALPADFVDAAVTLCTETLKKTEGPIADRVKKLITAFAAFGVTTAALEEKIGHALASAVEDDLVTLRGIYNAINKGVAKAADYFAPPEATAPAAAQPAAAAAPAAPQAQQPKTTATAAPAAAKTPAKATTAKAEAPKPEAKTEAPKAEAKTEAPATSTAAPAADAEAKPKTKRRMLIQDVVNETTGEVTKAEVPAPEGEETAATEAAAETAPEGAPAETPRAAAINEADDDIFG